MGWTKIGQFLVQLIGWVWDRFRPNRITASDSGLFDPYVPLGSVKRLSPTLHEEEEISGETPELEGVPQPFSSLFVFQTIILLAGLVIAFRLANLQITRGQENYSLAEGNRLKTNPLPAPRGLIYDRHGAALVSNIPNFSLILNSADYPTKKEERGLMLERLEAMTGRSKEELEKSIGENLNDQQITVAEGLTREESLVYELKLDNIKGLELIKLPVRQYTDLPSLGHLIGYTGKATEADLKENRPILPTSLVGRSGIEKTYDRFLQGKPGTETLEVDSLGRTVRSVGSRPPLVGRSLLLTIDQALQRQSAVSLKQSIETHQATSGAALALDPRNGEVLAMVSLPDFDANIFAPTGDATKRQELLTNPQTPLINRAIAGQYPSGSTIKPIVATAALEEKTITSQTKLDTSEGKIIIGQTTFSDWKTHGLTDITQALAESNNIFFYALGGGYKQIPGLGVNRLTDYYKRFGLGSLTEIDLPGETKGLVPTPDWKRKLRKESWFLGDTYNIAIGQGDLLVTPLQLGNAMAGIANNGTLFAPKLVKTILPLERAAALEQPNRVIRDHLADPANLETVRTGMRRAVQSGSARSFAALPVEVAAKTGTAQFNLAKERTHSWFAAFAPFRNPEIVIVVIVEGGGEGFAVAAPVAKNMLETYFKLSLTPIIAESEIPTTPPTPAP